MIYEFFKQNGFESVKEEYLTASQLGNSNVFEFPSSDIQMITNSMKGEATALSALEIYSALTKMLHQQELKSDPKILDYGCGWGRITRLFPTLTSDENVYGVDVDSRLISSANECASTMEFKEIESMGELPFDSGGFDLIFANSVFSHLSEKSAMSTLTELVRVLSLEGMLIVSVLELKEMEKFYSNQKQREWIEKILGTQEEATKMLTEKNFVWGDTKRWDNYGIAIMNDSWLEDHLSTIGAKLIDTYRSGAAGSQNYKIIVKNNLN